MRPGAYLQTHMQVIILDAAFGADGGLAGIETPLSNALVGLTLHLSGQGRSLRRNAADGDAQAAGFGAQCMASASNNQETTVGELAASFQQFDFDEQMNDGQAPAAHRRRVEGGGYAEVQVGSTMTGAPDPPAAGDARRRRREQVASQQRDVLRCRMCDGACAYHAQDSRGLLQHLVRMHLGQSLTAEAIAQLRSLDKVACRVCASIRARTSMQCSHCECATATRPLQLGDIVPDRRRGVGACAAEANGGADDVGAGTSDSWWSGARGCGMRKMCPKVRATGCARQRHGH
jgi:hypothetical protein